jgi:D-methionine transport system ATP-binding protein
LAAAVDSATLSGMQITPVAVSPPLIQLDAVRKAFRTPDGRRFEAVRETTLAVERGDVFGLVGKSGAGKSTLLRLVNLLERPDAGRVRVAGRDLTALGKAELREARQGIGMIFQQFNLLQNATVFDNVAFPLRIHGRHSSSAIAARVEECLALVGLQDKAASHPAQLSGGQKQRVAIARALASQPDVLLCDEPTSALDAETTESLLATLRDINRTLGVTIVIVTHELSVVTSLCRHVAVVEDGAIAERFALADTAHAAATRLGRDLLRLVEAPPAPAHSPSRDLREAVRA